MSITSDIQTLKKISRNFLSNCNYIIFDQSYNDIGIDKMPPE